MFLAEVVENKMAFKPDQKDDDGNILPLGSIQIRIGSHQSNLGQVRNIYCRPATFQRRIPVIGEQVLVTAAPVNDWSSTGIKNVGHIYFSPINATDDLVSHKMPFLWKRKSYTGGQAGDRKADRDENYTFPKNPSATKNIQPFEGDDIFEGRFGHSIRFGSTVMGEMGIYAEKPTWVGGSNGDPIAIIRVKKPSGGKGYTIEDIKDDDGSIYMTSTQALKNLKGGFDKNLEVKQLSSYKTTPQIIIDSGRVVINAKKDKLFLIGKEKAVLTGKKVVLQSDKYKVDLDDLMDFLKDWLDEDKALATGQAMFATPSGPTSTSTNMAKYLKLSTADFQKFKAP